tara:strand:+ start:65 stop:1111 length:1047 start_codon:yes stop_codon:yes gene_type:complete
MKLYKQIIFILVIFFKTETLFSENNLFNVNNIKLEKKDKSTNETLADQAIKQGFEQLVKKILLKEDSNKFTDLNFSSIKQLVSFYQISNDSNDEKKGRELVNFSITFDKEKIHNLFYERGILYSEISDKELYVLPIFIKKEEIFIFNNNFFYKEWNNIYKSDLIEFVLPLENIEIIRNINNLKNNLINLDMLNLFEEYKDKNLAFVLIEDNKDYIEKVYIKTMIQGKIISKNLTFKKKQQKSNNYKDVIEETKKELIDLVKAKNLIDIRTPSFLNVKLNTSKKNNLVELKSRIKTIDAIENIYVQDFNKDYMNLRIKYLGKLEKIIRSLKVNKIDLQLINDRWVIKTL